MGDQNKNLILATALSFMVILVWFLLFPPEQQAMDPAADGAVAQQAGGVAPAPPAGLDGTPLPPDAPEAVAAEMPRIPIETPRLKGSISLQGGRIDDLLLKDYRETTAPDSEIVRLLEPVGGRSAYYALYGWSPSGALGYEDVPDASTEWSLISGETLAPGQPVVLGWENDSGLTFTRRIEVDENYLFTITDGVQNAGDSAVRMTPYGIVARHGRPDTVDFFILHEGVVQMSDGSLNESKYKRMVEYPVIERERARATITEVATNGWIGFTDKYWMTTLIPTPGQPFTAVSKYVPGAEIYQTETRMPAVTVEPGQAAEVQNMLFAGAKEWETIRAYQNNLGIDRFIDSIDWGWFFFLTKPIFAVLHWLHGFIGNMGWSIIALTLLLKAVLFPLAYKSYVSMARMKELQPEMEKIKERAGDDRQKLQQEMMTLYREKKVNPAAGCLPILLQIPIFFSLYKVIFVTIELRHAPWIGWIDDLSAPDPSSIFNLFGLLPWAAPEPTSFLALIFIGVMPIALGVSMWLQQKLNPAPTDPTQKMIFAWMPWVFMFMLGSFASGLVLYWIANNMITFTQQYIIMRSHGHKPDLFGNIAAGFRRNKPAAK
ncbi:membrane protein insertase YidC [Plastorhodobacter daqingensis]|uniref:Membrane protein insertase YidC n=1 Tax=Plastorhodobacter daqingensis TaxID=1387281 RepID=A0ABW2UDY1_9RHOB